MDKRPSSRTIGKCNNISRGSSIRIIEGVLGDLLGSVRCRDRSLPKGANSVNNDLFDASQSDTRWIDSVETASGVRDHQSINACAAIKAIRDS
jgi:hypothetical protein